MAMEERRKYTRYPIKAPAEVLTPTGIIPALVTEISVGGLKLNSSKAFVPSMPIDVIINIGRQIVFGGQVVWVIEKLDRQGIFYQSGMDTDFTSDRDDEVLYFRRMETLVQEIAALIKAG